MNRLPIIKAQLEYARREADLIIDGPYTPNEMAARETSLHLIDAMTQMVTHLEESTNAK